MLDRFNVTVLFVDHSRSMVRYPTRKPDRFAKGVLYGLPLLVAGVVVAAQYSLSDPGALVPATGLMAGIFFAAVGQLISIRARVADSVALAGNPRLRAHFRESVSGMLLAALAALFASLSLGALTLLPSSVDPAQKLWKVELADVLHWGVVGISALVAALLSFMVLLFISSARRLYTSYLEAFEKGLPLPRNQRGEKSRTSVETPEVGDSAGSPHDGPSVVTAAPENSRS